MNFVSPNPKRLTRRDYQAAAKRWNIEWQAIEAFAVVESPRGAYRPDGRPYILYERHYFHRLTNGKYSRANPDLSNRRPGGYTRDEYARLERALKFDKDAALMSCSWGAFQMMGANWRMCDGIKNVTAFVRAMVDSPQFHLEALGAFLNATNLLDDLRGKRWETVARVYNGPQGVQRQYHIKLAKAYADIRKQALYFVVGEQTHIERIQTKLNEAMSLPNLKVDGLMGPKTRAMIRAFQRSRGLVDDGIAGPITCKELGVT